MCVYNIYNGSVINYVVDNCCYSCSVMAARSDHFVYDGWTDPYSTRRCCDYCGGKLTQRKKDTLADECHIGIITEHQVVRRRGCLLCDVDDASSLS